MLDTSGSMTLALDLVKSAAEQFLLRLLPEDQGMVGAFNDKIQFIPDGFTSSRDELVSKLKELDFGYPTRLYDAVNQSMAQLNGIPGRKVVLVFTDGDDNASKVGSGDMTDRARVEDVMMYSVGLENEYFDGARRGAVEPRSRAAEVIRGDRRRVLSAEEDGRAGPDLYPRRSGTAQPICAWVHSRRCSTARSTNSRCRVKKPAMTARARKSYRRAERTCDRSGDR